MRRVYVLVSRSLTLETYTVTAMFWALLAVWTQVTKYLLFIDPFSTVPFELPLQVALFAMLGAAYYVWMTLYVFGFVGVGSGAGFRLAILGLAARVMGSIIVVSPAAEPDGSNYVALWRGAGPVWWVRNLGVLTFGWGLALVVLASAMDLVRRRRHPRWMPIVD